jgi:adenylate cyclase
LTGPHLVVHTGARTIPLAGQHWTVGRAAESGIVIDDASISRKHAMLQRTEDNQVYLIDLGSRNGTFVNDRRVTVPTTVRDGDKLRFGLVECTFYWSEVWRPETMVVEGPATSMLQVRRLITVVVIDIREYTSLTRRTDEQVLSRLMAEWFRQVGGIVATTGGYVDKYIGDAVMAVWFHGQDRVDAQDMVRIARALSAIHTATSLLHETFELPTPLRIGAGVNTGFAVIGNTGTADRPDYTALGDTVNAAFRLESVTRRIAQDIAIGEATWDHLRTLAGDDLFERHMLDVKGYDDPMAVFAAPFGAIHSLLQRLDGQ